MNDGGIKRKLEAVLRRANIVRRIADAVIPEAKKGEYTHPPIISVGNHSFSRHRMDLVNQTISMHVRSP